MDLICIENAATANQEFAFLCDARLSPRHDRIWRERPQPWPQISYPITLVALALPLMQ